MKKLTLLFTVIFTCLLSISAFAQEAYKIRVKQKNASGEMELVEKTFSSKAEMEAEMKKMGMELRHEVDESATSVDKKVEVTKVNGKEVVSVTMTIVDQGKTKVIKKSYDSIEAMESDLEFNLDNQENKVNRIIKRVMKTVDDREVNGHMMISDGTHSEKVIWISDSKADASEMDIEKEIEVDVRDGKEVVKLKLTVKEDGEVKVIEKEYDSAEEMNNDAEIAKYNQIAHKVIIEEDFDEDHEHQNVFIQKGEGGQKKIIVKKAGDADVRVVERRRNVNKNVNVRKEGDKEIYEVELTVEEDGETKVIKKSFDSEEAMKSDPELKKYEMGGAHNIWFQKDGEELHSGENSKAFFFSDDLKEVTGNVIMIDGKKGLSDEMIQMLKEKGIELKSDDGQFELHFDREEMSDMKVLSMEGEGAGEHKKVMVFVATISSITISDVEAKEVQKLVPSASVSRKALAVDDLKYFPNPSDGKFTLEFQSKKKGGVGVQILDLAGKTVYDEAIEDFDGFYKNEIDMQGNAPGVYLMQIMQGNRVLNKKIVVE